MKMLATMVERLYAAGYPIGPAPDHPCPSCEHVWGNHLLYASVSNDPIDGGHTSCPFEPCGCAMPWALPEDTQEMIRAARRAKEKN